jgi:hypothetical protein
MQGKKWTNSTGILSILGLASVDSVGNSKMKKLQSPIPVFFFLQSLLLLIRNQQPFNVIRLLIAGVSSKHFFLYVSIHDFPRTYFLSNGIL